MKHYFNIKSIIFFIACSFIVYLFVDSQKVNSIFMFLSWQNQFHGNLYHSLLLFFAVNMLFAFLFKDNKILNSVFFIFSSVLLFSAMIKPLYVVFILLLGYEVQVSMIHNLFYSLFFVLVILLTLYVHFKGKFHLILLNSILLFCCASIVAVVVFYDVRMSERKEFDNKHMRSMEYYRLWQN